MRRRRPDSPSGPGFGNILSFRLICPQPHNFPRAPRPFPVANPEPAPLGASHCPTTLGLGLEDVWG